MLIVDLVLGKEMSREAIEDELYEICSSVHSSCDSNCPVYELNGGEIPPDEGKYGCMCFKNGAAMYRFIKENS